VSRADAIHAKVVPGYSDTALEGIYQDFRKLNLRDYSDNETRWKAGRLSAVAKERKRRKTAKNYQP
jgi:hypothetical protein